MTGNFLERWSKLKREQAAQPHTPPDNGPEATSLTAEDVQALIDALPDISTLTQDSDFSVFMNSWVPDDIRRDALRRLWTVDKSVLEHVPLADYALDYNTPGAAPGYGTITASADMIAEVARMMGKAAFPEPAPESLDYSGDGDPAAPPPELAVSAARENAPSAPIEKIITDAAEDDDASKSSDPLPDDDAALRQPLDAQSPLPILRRRHGAAAPR